MKPKTKKYVIKIFLALVLIAGFCVFKYLTQDISLRIENNSKTNIHDLKIGFRGGEIEVSDFPPSKKQSFKIEPTGESDLVIRWQEDDGEQFECDGDTYFEPNYATIFGMHFALLFQNDGAYLLVHSRHQIHVHDLKNRSVPPLNAPDGKIR